MKSKIAIMVLSLATLCSFADPTMVSNPTFNPANNLQATTGTQLVNTTNGVLVNPTVTGQTNSDLTASLPVFTDANKALASKTIAATKTALGIQAGTVVGTTDGTVTNTFATSFSSAPTVVLTPFNSAAGGTNNIVTHSTNGFFTAKILTGVTNYWVAIGPP